MDTKKVVLAYSGGLDTSCALYMLAQEGYEVTAVCVDVGQQEDLPAMKKKAEKIGAKEAIVIDATKEFAELYVKKTIYANGLYEGQYCLSTSIARPLIVKKVAEFAKKKGINTIAHGCKGKGSDFFRFYLYFKQLMPDVEFMSPISVWNPTRIEEVKFAEEKGIPVPVSSTGPYSYDNNLWGNSVNYGKIEDTWAPYPKEALTWSSNVKKEGATFIDIQFEKGVPVAVDGKKMPLKKVIEILNSIGSEYAVGITDLIEDSIQGTKGRYVYEAPAAHMLIQAHKKIESLTLPKSVLITKGDLDKKWAELCFDVYYYSAAKDAIDAFMENVQIFVEGTVKLKLSWKTIEIVGVSSKKSLYHKTSKKSDVMNGYENIVFSEVNKDVYAV